MNRFYHLAAVAFSSLLVVACSQQPAKPVALAYPPTALPDSRPVLTPDTSKVSQFEAFSERETSRPSQVIETPRVDNLWDRLFSLYRLPPSKHPRVQRELRWYLAHPSYIKRVQSRAKPYLYTIVEEIERAGLPGELALLPVVESAFRPSAYSHQRAAGLWQFIPSTGRIYGLEQNWWVDLRRDVHASTRAAINYLNKLQKDFDGDWLLALAAYNAGEGAVKRAIRRNRRLHRPTDFWHLRLPRETRAYVPKLLAVAHLFAHAEEYKIALEPIPNHPLYTEVQVGSQLDLILAAKLAEMPVEELYRLNPGFKRWATAPEGPHRLVLPMEKVELFQEKLAQLPENQRIQWRRHKVKRGDSLSRIAARYDTPVQIIRQVNHLRGNIIHPGRTLMIPVARTGKLPYSLASLNRVAPVLRAKERRTVYRVRRGDSLWKIARRHGVSLRQLARWNGLSTRARLRPGQHLIIKGGKRIKKPNRKTRTVHYKVRKGDSLSGIAQRFNVSVKALRQWNRNQIGKYLKPGQRLKVYVGKRIST